MFHLEDHLCQWRLETEATLAFDAEELDELEDHLRSSYETGLREQLLPEAAWQNAQRELGPASALAVEFTKRKLLPAFLRLLLSWWKPALFSTLLFAAFFLKIWSPGGLHFSEVLNEFGLGIASGYHSYGLWPH